MRIKLNKKPIFFTGIILVILLLIPVLLSKESNSPQNTSVITLPPTSPTTSTTVTPTTNPLTTYQGDSYTVMYPTGWTQNESELSNNNGTNLILQPPGTNSGNYSTITVEVLNSQNASINTLTRIFTMLHYTQTYTTIAGITAMEFTGVIPTQNGDLHSTAYIFEKNNKIYSVKLEYIQTDVNEQLEIQFNQLLGSLSIQ